jgi:hypothetical protein
MTYLDVAIPGVIGVWLLAWPRSVFYGSRQRPTAAKIRLLRGIGLALVVVAVIYLLIKISRH